MKKKIVAFLILIMVLIPLTGCNNKKVKDSKETNNTKEVNKDISTDESNDKDNDKNSNSNTETNNGLEENNNVNTNTAPKQDEKKANNKTNNNTNNSNNNSNTTPAGTPTNTPNSGNSNSNNNQNTQPTQPVKYNVYFNSNGGSSVQSQIIEEGQHASKPQNPSRDGYNFIEWTLNNETYDFSKTVNSNITLVAKWQKKAYIFTQSDAQSFVNQLKSYSNSKGMIEGPYEPVHEDAMSEHFYTSDVPYADPESYNEKYSKAISFINEELAKLPAGKKLVYRIFIKNINDGVTGNVKRYEVWMYVHSVDN